jgi:hypothetical protein
MILAVLLVFGLGFLFAGFLGLLVGFATRPKERPAKPE